MSARTAPNWAREYIAGIDLLQMERSHNWLETTLPNVRVTFTNLIDELPLPGSSLTEFPIASYVVMPKDGRLELVAKGTNEVNKHHDSIMHAEIVALQKAQRELGDKHLREAVLLSTVEPCVTCTGAAIWTEVKGVVYGASHEDLSDHAFVVNGEPKPFKKSPESFCGEAILNDAGIYVVGGYMAQEVLDRVSAFTS